MNNTGTVPKGIAEEIREELKEITQGEWLYLAEHDKYNPKRPLGFSLIYVRMKENNKTCVI
jgi:lauroyl/myristoyl acyltransferase